MNINIQPLDNPYLQSKNRWRSIDADFSDGAISMLVAFVVIKATNTFTWAGCEYAARLIAESVRLNIVDAPLTLTLDTS